ncbi:Gamma-tubulin complex component 3 [Trichinella pseudospiralis]|uniref:Gamma-tubulin complex component 3 n=1 Tax=Trichinella pseudospiralis TaxID=6337 RepID=A0A0V1K2Y4_TRIPS|nr:Gamma-tubulin complex component 3 [Trichinella pseudospiralis]
MVTVGAYVSRVGLPRELIIQSTRAQKLTSKNTRFTVPTPTRHSHIQKIDQQYNIYLQIPGPSPIHHRSFILLPLRDIDMAYNRYTTNLLSYTSRTHRPRCISNLATALVNACSSFFALLPTFRRSAAGHGRVLEISFLKSKMIDLESELRKLVKAMLKVDTLIELYDKKFSRAVLILNNFKVEESVNAERQMESIQRNSAIFLLLRNQSETAVLFNSLWQDLKKMRFEKAGEMLRFFVAVNRCMKGGNTMHSEGKEALSELSDRASTSSDRCENVKFNVECNKTFTPVNVHDQVGKSSDSNLIVASRNTHNPEIIMCDTDAVIHESLFVLQGISGNLICINHTAEEIEFTLPIKRSLGEQLKMLSVYGFLYLKLKRFCDAYLDPSTGKSFLSAFAVSVDKFLAQYYQVIAELEVEWFSKLSEKRESSGRQLGLLSEEIFVKLWPFKSTMLELSEIVATAAELSSGNFLSSLYEKVYCGDSAVANAIVDALSTVCCKLKRMITSWMYEGVIEDHGEEFFIYQQKETANSSSSLWNMSYQIRHSCIPDFFSPYLVKKILITGKSVIFLQNACCESLDIPSVRSQRRLFEEMDPSWMFLIEKYVVVSSCIKKTYKEVSRVLLNLLSSKFNVEFHLKALKNYVLLSRGDFVSCMLENFHEELDNPNSVLRMDALTFALENALRDCATKFDITHEIIDKIFNDKTKPIYRLLFNFIWRLRRMDFVLHSYGLNCISFSKGLKIVPEFYNLWQKFSLMNNELSNFVRNVQHYFFFQVLENAWRKFISGLHSAVDLDDVINEHDAFLNQLVDNMFLSEKHANVMLHLRTLLDFVFDFQKLYGEFISLMEDEIENREEQQLTTRPEEEVPKTGKLSISKEQELKQQVYKKTMLEDLNSKFCTPLTLFRDGYRMAVSQLLIVLANGKDDLLRQFSFQIDFSQWYYNQNENVRNSILRCNI